MGNLAQGVAILEGSWYGEPMINIEQFMVIRTADGAPVYGPDSYVNALRWQHRAQHSTRQPHHLVSCDLTEERNAGKVNP